MKYRYSVSTLLLSFVLGFSAPVFSQTDSMPSAEDPAHAQLRTLKSKVMESFNKKDYETFLTYVHPDVVIAWANGEVSRGHEGLMAYIKKMTEGPNKVLESFELNPEASELSIIYGGDSAISWGQSKDHYKLTSGPDIKVDSLWTANMVRVGDGWQIAAFHGSMNPFDNPIMEQMTKTFIWIGVGLVALGFAAGLIFMRIFSKKR